MELFEYMKKSFWIIIVLLIVILIVLFLFVNNQTQEETEKAETQDASAEYQDIQTSDDVFNQIDESLNYIGE